MPSRLLLFIIGLSVAGAVHSLLAQAVEGRVELPTASLANVASQRYQSNPGIHADSPDAPAAVVFLDGPFANVTSHEETEVAEMAQKNLAFSPGLLPIRVGTTVEFPNLDDTYHNVFSYSKIKRFDLGRYRNGERSGSILFDKPGVVTLHCEIHSSMRGTILILDTPYFQKTDAKGFYHLTHLPIGHYLLKAWVDENDVRVQPVDLTAGVTLHLDFKHR